MITIKNWDKEIQQAKYEIIQAKKNACFKDGDLKKPIEVKAWFIGQWETGFVCVDLEELMKLPKKQRDKILKLGGIQS